MNAPNKRTPQTRQHALQLLGGSDNGPLFAPLRVRRPAAPSWRSAARFHALIKRTPPWVTREEVLAIEKAARQMTLSTGVQHSVDHVVPLRHPLVCGLHCPANLRVIPLVENIHKGNRWWPDAPFEQKELL